MNHLQDIVENYLKTREPYAIQIDGKWGVGKTYYIK
ncbi:chromosomal replication initiator DnaA, partial [Enterococcus faecium]|nr:chromosomal replication initiator DnaA [Enterococcus faecium]